MSQEENILGVVSQDKKDLLNTGTIGDSEQNATSTLSQAGGVVGERLQKTTRASAKNGARGALGAKATKDTSKTLKDAQNAKKRADKLKGAKDAAKAKVVDQLDQSEELNGIREIYDAEQAGKAAAKRALDLAKNAKNKHKAAKQAKKASKKASGLGAKKGASKAAKTAMEKKLEQKAAKAATKTVAKKGIGQILLAALTSKAAIIVGGILAALFVFFLAVFALTQMFSAIFGFAADEEQNKMLEGLPAYITYSMVEECLECQEEYGHPAACTLAQIIVESGAGDTPSKLASEQKNLFGIKWASSYAAQEEINAAPNQYKAYSTHEYYDGSTQTTITAKFTWFKSMEKCIRFRSRYMLQRAPYSTNKTIKAAIKECDSDKMAKGLKSAGWATSDAYVQSLKDTMKKYDLYIYDGMSVKDFKNTSNIGKKVVQVAKTQLGVPYVWGGETPYKALDCSGLTMYCYSQVGIKLTHYTETQLKECKRKVLVKNARVGDILYRKGHVAIYVGKGKYIQAPHPGAVVSYGDNLSSFTWALQMY